jgi:hypothetical protein
MSLSGAGPAVPNRRWFLAGVFLITFAVLVFQVVQTRILSVIAWYYLAFFAISVAMLGMTAGAVWVYVRRARLARDALPTLLSDSALLAAVAMPASLLVQFSLITNPAPTVTSVFASALQMTAMAVPYFFAGITVSLALTRSPFPVSQVYGVDLLGAALGCAGVVGLLEIVDGPTAILVAGLLAALAAGAFARAAPPLERAVLAGRPRWRRPAMLIAGLAVAVPLNARLPFGFKPMLVKGNIESRERVRVERWNSYSRVLAREPDFGELALWGPSPIYDRSRVGHQVALNIDGSAATTIPRFDGSKASIDFLAYDVVNLAYTLPGLRKSAVIGVGGGRDVMAAHLAGVQEITGVEVNRVFVDLLTKDPFYAPFANLAAMPGVKLYVDDARSWFAASHESFDLIEMSLIDTWAATAAGAFSLSENGLYTLEGWRAFIGRLNDDGVFTVSRWYAPNDVNETGRMLSLAVGALLDSGAKEPRRHLFIADAGSIATLILSKSPLSPERLHRLRVETERLQFHVLVSPDMQPDSPVLRAIVGAQDTAQLAAAARTATADLSVPSDMRPFFFNQLRFSDIPRLIVRSLRHRGGIGVLSGNMSASIVLVTILLLALLACWLTIVLPLRTAARTAPRRLLVAGTFYFSLIGMGFMFAEISLLQMFGVFLGHPTYAMGVCLFSLILSSGLGSLASGRLPLDTGRRIAIWGALVGGYLLLAQGRLPHVFAATTAAALPVRVLVCLAVVTPVGFAMGFAFPTGMRLVQRIDAEPTPWFWGINGATGVLASVVAVMIGISFGIDVTMIVAALCYLALIPTARILLRARA